MGTTLVRKMRKHLKNEKGAAMLEGMVSMVWLLFLTSFILSSALLLYNWMVLEDATRDTARKIALGSATTDAQNHVRNLAGPIILGRKNLSDFRVTVDSSSSSDKVWVTTEYDSLTFLPGMGLAFGGKAFDPYTTIKAKASFKKELP